MSDPKASELSKLEGNLAMRQAEQIALLSEPISSWPERASGLLYLLFVIFLVDMPEDSRLAKILIIVLFIGATTCHWYVISKLRSKIEALSQFAYDSHT